MLTCLIRIKVELFKLAIFEEEYISYCTDFFKKRSGLGGYGSRGTPVPISNTEVKPTCADGT